MMFEESRNRRPYRVEVRVGDGFAIEAKGVGDVSVKGLDNSIVTIPKCLWVPDLKLNLVSVSHLDGEGFETTFGDGIASISKDQAVVLQGYQRQNLYHLQALPIGNELALLIGSDILHQRLGHFAARKIKRLSGIVDGLSLKETSAIPTKLLCDACAQAKGKRASFPPSDSHTHQMLELFHMDLAGPSEVSLLEGNVTC
jgi:hypothetical protein